MHALRVDYAVAAQRQRMRQAIARQGALADIRRQWRVWIS